MSSMGAYTPSLFKNHRRNKMFNVFGEISWLGVAAATLATAVLGAVWFTALFGKYYTLALGREGLPPFKMTPIFMAGPFRCGLVTSIACAILLRALGINTYGEGLVFGMIAGLGFLTTTTVNTGINPNIPRPLLYGVISGSYFLVAGVMISLILTAVR
jgi:Protein of unknown function (DUF1761)